MTIEITKPEIEILIRQRMQSGIYGSAEDVILQALRSLGSSHQTGADLVAAMQSSPHKEVDFEASRDRLPVRDITF
jgi:Arc/MetJ-type ribon-helix-helix transcriptional regulator